MAGSNNNGPQTELELRYFITVAQAQEETKRKYKQIEEEEKTKRKQIEEEEQTKRKQIEEETKRKYKQIEEEEETKRKKIEEETKRMQIKHTQSSSLNDLLWSSHKDFYDNVVHGNLHDFEIDWMQSNDNEYFNSTIKNLIQDYLNKLPCLKRGNETELQKIFDELIINLLNVFNNSTLLKYRNTVSSYYLKSKYSPDSTFIFKNINVNNNCLQDFAVCIGELKCTNTDMNETTSIGQLLQYLNLLLIKQARPKIYGFLLNIKCIKFFYVERKPNSNEYIFYQSESLSIYETTTTAANEQSKFFFNYCERTWKIFIKFLRMNKSFYQYELNIDPYDNKLNQYLIKKILGHGLTSRVYLLNQEENNEKEKRKKKKKLRKMILMM